MCHTAPTPYVSCLEGNKTKRIYIHVYLGLLVRRLDSSTMAICKFESQKNNQVAHRSKRPEVMDQGPGLWLQPVAEEWPVWMCAERLKMLESGVPGWGQAAGTQLSGRAEMHALAAFTFFLLWFHWGPSLLDSTTKFREILSPSVTVFHVGHLWRHRHIQECLY